MTPADQLAALPEPVQAELWAIARAAIGMDRDETEAFLTALVGVAEAFIWHGTSDQVTVIQLLNAVAQVVTEVDRAAFPRTQETI